MQVKYSEKLAEQNFGRESKEYYNAVGINHRNIGISLCSTMRLDYKSFETYKRSCRKFTDPEEVEKYLAEQEREEEERHKKLMEQYRF